MIGVGIFLVVAGIGTTLFESYAVGPLIIALGAVAIWWGNRENQPEAYPPTRFLTKDEAIEQLRAEAHPEKAGTCQFCGSALTAGSPWCPRCGAKIR